MPSAKDDAEIGGIPREEHLKLTCQQGLAKLDKRAKRLRAFMLHMGPLAGMPWAIWS